MQHAITYESLYLDTVNARDIRFGVITFKNPEHFWSSSKYEWGTRLEEHRFNPHTVSLLSEILDKIEADPSISGLILTGEGKYFSNGLDVDFIRSHPEQANTLQKNLEQVLARILSLGVITVGVLNGHTTAAGAILALCCDYRIMAERGLFLLPAVALGIVYSQGFVEIAKSKISSPSVLRDMLLLSRRYSSADLCDLGLVECVSSGESAIDAATLLIRTNQQEHRFSLAEVKRRLFHDALSALTDERVSDMHWDRLPSLRPKL